MSEPEPREPQEEQSGRSRFSGLHSRTYEMELLLSGAVVFGLIHLPPVAERVFTSFRAGLDGNLRLVGTLGYTYVQLALYGLIFAFVLHLAMRGFWIGLLGLESVFPDGIRWDRLELGPASIKHFRKRIGSLADAVEKVDDLCSMIFSFGFMVVFIWVYIAAVLAGAAIVGFGTSELLLGGHGAGTVFWVVAGLLLGIQPLAQFLDKVAGKHARPDGFIARTCDLLIRVSYALSPMRLTGATQLTLASNLSGARVSTVMLVAMFGLAAAFLGTQLLGQGVIRFDSLTFFPDSLREQGLDPRHYRVLRSPAAVEPKLPTIQSDIVEQPYLKLFLPYLPRRDNPLVAKKCPELEAISDAGFAAGFPAELTDARAREVSACLGSLFEISVDGERRHDLHFDFTLEASSGLEGVVSYLPVRGLEPGRHELEVLAPHRQRRSSESGKPHPPVRHLIPFWL